MLVGRWRTKSRAGQLVNNKSDAYYVTLLTTTKACTRRRNKVMSMFIFYDRCLIKIKWIQIKHVQTAQPNKHVGKHDALCFGCLPEFTYLHCRRLFIGYVNTLLVISTRKTLPENVHLTAQTQLLPSIWSEAFLLSRDRFELLALTRVNISLS